MHQFSDSLFSTLSSNETSKNQGLDWPPAATCGDTDSKANTELHLCVICGVLFRLSRRRDVGHSYPKA